MFSLFGAPALSPFRLDHALRVLQAEDKRVTALSCRWLHFVDESRTLAEAELGLLGKLLTYGPRTELREERGQRVLVTPRVGTESPWSSKATDIAQVCGLGSVQRIERGILYHVGLDAQMAFLTRGGMHTRLVEPGVGGRTDNRQLQQRQHRNAPPAQGSDGDEQ